VSPRKRTDQRGEKSTELINRTKTSFVNRSDRPARLQASTKAPFSLQPFCHVAIDVQANIASGKSLVIEFSTEVLQSILVIWFLTQTGIGSFAAESVSF
jgi:hypothetical protein